MTPAAFEKEMSDLCTTTSREILWNHGLTLIRDALGDNAHNYLKGVDVFLEPVKQLGLPVTPVPFQGKREEAVAL